MFSGSNTALITPFRGAKVDETAFQALVEWQINEGTHGLVPCGTTGEASTLTHAEHRRVVELCVEAAAGRVPVIAGAGSNYTDRGVALAKELKEAGADALLVVSPYYVKPNQEGLYQHFRAVHDATDLPMVLYNIPGRSCVDVSVETMARLNDDLENFVAIKDATGDLARVPLQRDAMGADFCQLSGEDMTALAFNASGGRGCISVTANVAPRLCAELQEATLKGDMETALVIQDQLAPLHAAMFVDASPGPVKFAASLLGICTEDLRLPMTPPNAAVKAIVASAVARAGLKPAAEQA